MHRAGRQTDAQGGAAGRTGRLLACYLFSQKDAMPSLPFLSNGIKPWLESQLPKYALIYPAQHTCIEKAIKFLPVLDRGLAASAAARVPPPSFDSPSAAASRAQPAAAPPPDF